VALYRDHAFYATGLDWAYGLTFPGLYKSSKTSARGKVAIKSQFYWAARHRLLTHGSMRHRKCDVSLQVGEDKPMKDEIMRRAVRLAIENVYSGNGGPFAAIVVKGNSVVAEGQNCVTSSNDPTAHAEIVALRRACKAIGHFELKGCELYSTCEPCPMCWGAIYWARVDKVIFGSTTRDAADIGFDDSFIEQELRLPHHHRRITSEQLLREHANEAFLIWSKKIDKVPY